MPLMLMTPLRYITPIYRYQRRHRPRSLLYLNPFRYRRPPHYQAMNRQSRPPLAKTKTTTTTTATATVKSPAYRPIHLSWRPRSLLCRRRPLLNP